ncbi:mutS protein homolog 4-like isoform X2 [Leptidea sinapis]|nr:mutS protein homolog 4-like isoform X2 [Leptidea sinapis]
MGSLQRCFAVKPQINGLLDVARRTYSELIEDIQKNVEQLGESFELPLRLNQNVLKGFHIVLPIPKNRRDFNVEDLPPIFIQVVHKGASVTMTTEELVVLDQQAKEALNEIQKMSNIVIAVLLRDLRPFMPSLYKLCENVAELDILIALAQISTVGSYVRPEFSDYMEIRNSVHPLLDYNCQVMPVPNDIFATPEHNFTLITGPNMGGKSIYIKQIAIMQVMAQLGCFLPATSAVLRLTDRIFSRIGFNDSVELNASTFVVEMKEVQHILQGLTPSSLVIIDELCRGTCVEEGTSIAWAICEELLLSDAFTFFTTHFMCLTRLQDLYYNVINRHTTVTEENSGDVHKRLIYQHKIELGITNIEHYGLALAAKTNLPVETVHLARELADFITKNRKPQHQEAKNVSDDYILYQLNAKIKQEMRRNHNYEEAINIIINRFAQENPALIRKLRKENSSTSTDFNENNTNTPENATEVKTSEILSETNQSNNNSKSAKVCVINAESGMEIMNNIESENSFTREDFTENPEGMGGDNKSNVKTSTDMLCTIDNEAENLFSRATNQNNSDQSKLSYETNHAQTGHNKAFESDNIVIDDNINGFMGSAPDRNETDNKNANTSCDSSSSLAEALTQIIYSSNSDSDKSVDFISTDEELVDETIRELNIFTTELTELQNIILTPPIGFRDT